MFTTSQFEKINPSQVLTLEPIHRSNKNDSRAILELDNWVSIKVANNHLEDVVECFGHLEINSEPITLSWHMNPANKLETIRGNTSSLLNVARTNIVKNDGFYIAGQESDFPTFPQGEYRIKVQVGGKINKLRLIPAVFLGQLICKNNSLILRGSQISDSGLLPNPTTKIQPHVPHNLLVHLRQVLADRFSSGDLQTLCFDLGVAYENLSGEEHRLMALNLVQLLQRTNRIDEMIEIGKQIRPDVPWELNA